MKNINKFENQKLPLDLEKMKQDFESFKNAGIPKKTYSKLSEMFLDDELKPYEETYNQLDYPRVSNEGNDEKFLTKQEAIEFLNNKFTGNILQKALVSGVELRLDEINYRPEKENTFGIKEGEYYLPKENFLAYFNKLSPEQQKEITENIYHAESYANWNREVDKEGEIGVGTMLAESGQVFPSPVALFNLEFDEESKAIKEGKLEEVGLAYLTDVEASERLKVYALGTIAHELAHNIFQHLMYEKSNAKEWAEIVDRLGSVTKYAEEYKGDALTHYDENFAEAVRLFTTTRNYLEKSGHSEMARFIEKYFPEIQS